MKTKDADKLRMEARRQAWVLDRDLCLCQVCKAKGKNRTARQVQHINPLDAGGVDQFRNLQAVCDECASDA